MATTAAATAAESTGLRSCCFVIVKNRSPFPGGTQSSAAVCCPQRPVWTNHLPLPRPSYVNCNRAPPLPGWLTTPTTLTTLVTRLARTHADFRSNHRLLSRRRFAANRAANEGRRNFSHNLELPSSRHSRCLPQLFPLPPPPREYSQDRKRTLTQSSSSFLLSLCCNAAADAAATTWRPNYASARCREQPLVAVGEIFPHIRFRARARALAQQR